MDDFEEECFALLGMFEQRGVTPREACAVMGLAIQALIADQSTAQEFIATLQAQFKERWN